MRARRNRQVGAAGAGTTVAVLAIALCLASGIGPWELVRYAGFHLLWVLAPGLVAAGWLVPGASGLRRAVLGWGLGYPLEMAAFAATAAAGARDAFLLWPVVAAAGALALRRRGRGQPPARSAAAAAGSGARLLMVLLAAVLLVHLASFSTEESPLTPIAPTESLYMDYVWNLGYAAEARHRWPMRDFNVSGEPRPYHSGWALDAAAANQVTGVRLEAIVSRLQPLALSLALVAGFAVLGGAVAGSASSGLLGLALFLFAGDALAGGFGEVRQGLRGVLTDVSYSPSFLLGVVLWIVALVLVLEIVRPREAQPGRGTWTALAVVLCGCAIAKSLLVPMLVASLALMVAGSLTRAYSRPRSSVGLLALASAVLGLSLATIYAKAGAVLELDPLAHLWSPPDLPGPLAALISVPGATMSVLALLIAPLIGLLWVPRRSDPAIALTLAVLAVGVGGTTLTATDARDEVYFLQYGLVPAVVLSAHGIARVARQRDVRLTRTAKLAVSTLALLALLGLDVPHDRGDWVRALQVVAVSALAVALAVRARRAGERGRPTATAVLALVAVVATAETQPRPFYELRAAARLAASAGLPVHAPARAPAALHPARAPGVGSAPRTPMPSGLLAGLRWIRRNTPADAVLIGPRRRDGLRAETEFGYAAFSERRTVIAGTLFTLAAANAGYETVLRDPTPLFPVRDRLQDRVFDRCDSSAVRTLVKRFRATHLLVDRTRGEPMPACLRGFGRVVFANRDLDIVDLR